MIVEALTVITQRQFMHPILAGRLASYSLYRYTAGRPIPVTIDNSAHGAYAFGPKINYTDVCNYCVSIFG